MRTLSLLLLLGCGHAAPAPVMTAEGPTAPEAAPPPEVVVETPEFTRLDAETQAGFAGDAEVTVPAGWWVATTQGGAVLHLQSPEEDLRMVFLERPAPADFGDGEAVVGAMQAAWRTVDPSFERSVMQAMPITVERGWDGMAQVVFSTMPTEERALVGVVHQKDQRMMLALIDGTTDALGRRGAQLNGIVGSLSMPGIADVSWMDLERRPLDAAAITRLEERIEAARVAAGVPGAAVVLVDSDGVLLSRGFGLRAQNEAAPVTGRTLFMIGSTTKALTSLLAAKLVSRGRLRWNQPVTELLPEFHFADPARTAEVTIAHTLCACTGLPRRDLEFLFEFAESSPESWLNLLGTMSPTTDFGETFQYSNLLVAAGGFAISRAVEPRRPLTQAYTRALDQQILRPLGMRSTTLDSARARRGDHAEPHARGLDDAVHDLRPDVEGFVTEIAPAGGAWSNVEDMGRYLQMELRGGALPRGRLLEEEALMRRREPGVSVGRGVNYGLGLMVGEQNGVAHVGHGGNTIGFTTEMVFYPELDLGMVVLANVGNANDFTRAVGRMVMEAVFPIEVSAETRAERERDTRHAALARMTAELHEPTQAEYSPILGRYRSPELGKMEVRIEAGVLIADVDEWTSRLQRMSPATGGMWMFVDAPATGLPMRVDGDDLIIDVPQHDYRFTREAIIGGSTIDEGA